MDILKCFFLVSNGITTSYTILNNLPLKQMKIDGEDQYKISSEEFWNTWIRKNDYRPEKCKVDFCILFDDHSFVDTQCNHEFNLVENTSWTLKELELLVKAEYTYDSKDNTIVLDNGTLHINIKPIESQDYSQPFCELIHDDVIIENTHDLACGHGVKDLSNDDNIVKEYFHSKTLQYKNN